MFCLMGDIDTTIYILGEENWQITSAIKFWTKESGPYTLRFFIRFTLGNPKFGCPSCAMKQLQSNLCLHNFTASSMTTLKDWGWRNSGHSCGSGLAWSSLVCRCGVPSCRYSMASSPLKGSSLPRACPALMSLALMAWFWKLGSEGQGVVRVCYFSYVEGMQIYFSDDLPYILLNSVKQNLTHALSQWLDFWPFSSRALLKSLLWVQLRSRFQPLQFSFNSIWLCIFWFVPLLKRLDM